MRKVVALDVDEVLNAAGNGGTLHHVHVKKDDLPDSPFVRGHGQKDLHLWVSLHPDHGAWIRSLLNRGIEVAWATTWENAANVHLAPLLGVPELPVAVCAKKHPPRFGWVKDGLVAEWKASVLGEFYSDPDTALVWADDMAGRFDPDSTLTDREVLLAAGVPVDEIKGHWFDLHRSIFRDGPTLVIVPDTSGPNDYHQGLTADHMSRIDAWLEEQDGP